jgi:uncharacterized membrane protein YhfC
MLYILYPLDALLMIGMPIALGVWLARKTKAPWLLFGVGAVTFIGSQVVHIPLNAGLQALFNRIWPPATTPLQWWHIPFNAVILGLTAGLCEETARYIGFRWLAKRARHFRDALMLGAGHGGTEAIILGALVGLTFVNMVIIRQVGPSALGLSGQALAQTQQAVAAYWSAPWYMALLGAVERLFALVVQVSLAVLVLQVFIRHDWRWLVVAIGYHMAVDGMAVVGVQSHWPPLVIEAAVAVFAVISLGIILGLRPRGEPLVPVEPEPLLMPGSSRSPQFPSGSVTRTHDKLDDSRFA